jgi:biopolymer transport protein ExbB/TolQ
MKHFSLSNRTFTLSMVSIVSFSLTACASVDSMKLIERKVELVEQRQLATARQTTATVAELQRLQDELTKRLNSEAHLSTETRRLLQQAKQVTDRLVIHQKGGTDVLIIRP